MKINCEHKTNKKKNKNRKRSKKRRNSKKKLKEHKNQSVIDFIRLHLPKGMSGECYWKNYNNVIQWQKHYLNYTHGNKLATELTSLNRPTSKLIYSEVEESESMIDTSLGYQLSEASSEYKTISSEVDEELEVTEEMMDFLEKSMKHKEAMRLEREAELALIREKNDANKTEEVSGRDDIEECQAPKERMVDQNRIEEMNELYGKASAMILGMETAIQLTFNRNCDLYKPSFWPCLPLKMNFNN